MNNKNIFLICGEAGSGKTQFAEYLRDSIDKRTSNKSLVRGNAQSVKDKARDDFNWNGVKDFEGRQLLIDITNEYYALDRYYWEKSLLKAFNQYIEVHKDCDTLIVPDWRFPQTKSFFEEEFCSVTTIEVVRHDKEECTHKNHSSENNFKTFNSEWTIYNNEDLESLREKAEKLVAWTIK